MIKLLLLHWIFNESNLNLLKLSYWQLLLNFTKRQLNKQDMAKQENVGGRALCFGSCPACCPGGARWCRMCCLLVAGAIERRSHISPWHILMQNCNEVLDKDVKILVKIGIQEKQGLPGLIRINNFSNYHLTLSLGHITTVTSR